MSYKYWSIDSHQWTSSYIIGVLVLIGLKMKDMKNTNGFQDVFLKNVPPKKYKIFFIISNKVFDSTLEKTK